MRFMQTESVLQTKNRSETAKNRFSVALPPAICLPLREHVSLTPMITNRKKLEKGHNSINYVWNLFKIYSGHLHLGHNLCAKYHDPSSSGYPDILFTMSLIAKMPKSEKGHNSVKYSKNFMKS